MSLFPLHVHVAGHSTLSLNKLRYFRCWVCCASAGCTFGDSFLTEVCTDTSWESWAMHISFKLPAWQSRCGNDYRWYVASGSCSFTWALIERGHELFLWNLCYVSCPDNVNLKKNFCVRPLLLLGQTVPDCTEGRSFLWDAQHWHISGWALAVPSKIFDMPDPQIFTGK